MHETERPELVVIETAETSDGSSQSEHHDGHDDDDAGYEPREGVEDNNEAEKDDQN